MPRMREYSGRAPLPPMQRQVDEAGGRVCSKSAGSSCGCFGRAVRKRIAQAQPVIVVDQDSPARIRLDVASPAEGKANDTEQLEHSLTTCDLGDSRLMLNTELPVLKSGVLLAKSPLVVQQGKRARIETGSEGAGHLIRLDLLALALRSGADLH